MSTIKLAGNDEFGDYIEIDGEEFGPVDGSEYDIPASRLRDARLADLPIGVSIRLCNRVIGSKDLDPRQPYCSFERREGGMFRAKCETAFIHEDESLATDILKQLL